MDLQWHGRLRWPLTPPASQRWRQRSASLSCRLCHPAGNKSNGRPCPRALCNARLTLLTRDGFAGTVDLRLFHFDAKPCALIMENNSDGLDDQLVRMCLAVNDDFMLVLLGSSDVVEMLLG